MASYCELQRCSGGRRQLDCSRPAHRKGEEGSSCDAHPAFLSQGQGHTGTLVNPPHSPFYVEGSDSGMTHSQPDFARRPWGGTCPSPSPDPVVNRLGKGSRVGLHSYLWALGAGPTSPPFSFSFENTRWWGAACRPPSATRRPSIACGSLRLTMLLPSPASGTLYLS